MRSSEGGLLTVSTKVEFKSSAKQQGRTDIEDRVWTRDGGQSGWNEYRQCHGNRYTTVRKVDSQWEFAV